MAWQNLQIQNYCILLGVNASLRTLKTLVEVAIQVQIVTLSPHMHKLAEKPQHQDMLLIAQNDDAVRESTGLTHKH